MFTDKKNKLSNTSLLWLVAFVMLIFTATSILIDSFYLDRALKVRFEANVEISKNRFDNLKNRDAGALTVALRILLEDEKLKNIYLEKDREKLYQHINALFEKNRNSFGITHWYFIDLNDQVFLRAHKKDLYGDIVNRITYKKAKETNDFSSGIEFGKTAFALRVVAPYYYQGELIGYMELGQEIDHFLNDLRKETGSDFAIVLDKENVPKEDWAQLKMQREERDNWDDLEKLLISERSFGEGSDQEDILLKSLSSKQSSDESSLDYLGKYKNKDITYSVGKFNIESVSGGSIGSVYVLENINSMLAINQDRIKVIASILSFSYFILMVILYLIFKKFLKARERYDVLYNSSADAIMILEFPSGKFISGNDATLKLFNLKNEEELVKLKPADLSPERQSDGELSRKKAKKMISKAINEGSNFFEWIHKQYRGENFHASVLLTRVEIDGKKVLQATVRNIDKQKKDKIRLADNLGELEKLNKLMVGRELKMLELKKEINKLKNK